MILYKVKIKAYSSLITCCDYIRLMQACSLGLRLTVLGWSHTVPVMPLIGGCDKIKNHSDSKKGKKNPPFTIDFGTKYSMRKKSMKIN